MIAFRGDPKKPYSLGWSDSTNDFGAIVLHAQNTLPPKKGRVEEPPAVRGKLDGVPPQHEGAHRKLPNESLLAPHRVNKFGYVDIDVPKLLLATI